MRAEAALTNSDSHAATQQQDTAYSYPDQACICTSAGCHGHAQAVLQSGFAECYVERSKFAKYAMALKAETHNKA